MRLYHPGLGRTIVCNARQARVLGQSGWVDVPTVDEPDDADVETPTLDDPPVAPEPGYQAN